jgi:hypothetical protein
MDKTPRLQGYLPDRLIYALLLALLLQPAAANAIFSQPAVLVNSGPVRVNVDIEISEATKLLPKTSIRSHIEDRLLAGGVAVIRDGGDQQLPTVVTPSEREPAQIWVNLSARRIAEPSGYIVSMEVSHLQPSLLRRVETVPIDGLGWHESWASIVADGSDIVAATDSALDSLIDDFARDYQGAMGADRNQ